MDVGTAMAYWSEATKQAILREQDSRVGAWPEPDLGRRLADAAFLGRLWTVLGDLERQAACFLMREAPGGFCRKKDWEQAAAAVHPHLSVGLTGLRRLGLVLTVRKLWSEIGYFMPLEVREALAASLVEPVAETDRAGERERVLTYYIPSGRGIHLDLFACLSSLRAEGLPVTRKGVPHRRRLQALAGCLSMTPEHTGCLEALLKEKDGGHPAAGVMLDLALRLGVIRCVNQRLELDPAAVPAWLALDPEARQERMFRLVCAHYLPRLPWLEALTFSLRACRRLGWVALDAALTGLVRAGYRVPDDAAEQARPWLHLLLGFGWILLGEDEGSRLFVQWNPLAREEEEAAWYVEPAGEVLLAPTVPLGRLWELDRIADLSFAGDAVRAVLSPAKVQAFVATGGSASDVLAFLQAGCPYPLPAPVQDNVRRWAKTARRIRFERVVRVRTAAPEVLAELRSLPSLVPFLAEVVSETDFLIPADQEEELYGLLRRLGYEPQAGSSGPHRRLGETDRTAAAGPTADTGAGLFHAELPWDGFQVENVFPDRHDSLPALHTLPKMWTSHYQSYHPQTLRTLFQRARELHLEVLAEGADGSEWRGVPEQVEVQMGYWLVSLREGGSRRQLRIDDVRRVRILLPEYL